MATPDSDRKGLFDKEVETYNANKEALLNEHKGKYVIIKGDQIVKMFASEEDAIRHGRETFPTGELFFVRQIADVEPVILLKGYNVPCLVSRPHVTLTAP